MAAAREMNTQGLNCTEFYLVIQDAELQEVGGAA
jgi:hypothetical protein